MTMTVEKVHSIFSSKDSVVTDEEACFFMEKLLVSYNAEAAILDYMTALAHISENKPHLFEEIFIYPAGAFVCMGVSTQNEAQYYIDYLLADKKIAKYRPLSVEAEAWLREQWPSFKGTINAVLADELKKALEG
jgi:hypothetical protein